MDAPRQRDVIVIALASNDAEMRFAEPMKTKEVPAIVREDSSRLRNRKRKDVLIRLALIGLTGFLGGDDIMTLGSQLGDRRVRKVLVGVQTRHTLFILVVRLDQLRDFLRMIAPIRPGYVQVGLREIWIAFQDPRV